MIGRTNVERRRWNLGVFLLILGASSLGSALASSDPGSTHGSIAASAGTSGSVAKPSFSKARSALKAGRLDEARAIYAALLDKGASGDKRAEALYWVGMLGLEPGGSAQETEKAESALVELQKSHPRWERSREASIALALARQNEQTRATLDAQRAEASRLLEACRSEEQEIGARIEAFKQESTTLKSALETCRADEQGLREEVQRKDEILKGKDQALKKVKEVLVDWKEPR